MDGVTYKGKVQKEYAGFVKEMFTLADNFSIDCQRKFFFLIFKKFFFLSFDGNENRAKGNIDRSPIFDCTYSLSS